MGCQGVPKFNLGTRAKPRGDGGGVAGVVIMSEIGNARGFLYGLARFLGWLQIIIDLFTGHTKMACKKLSNKFIGRKIGSKIYFK